MAEAKQAIVAMEADIQYVLEADKREFKKAGKPIVIILGCHNNAIIGYLQFVEARIPKTVLPNGAVIKIIFQDGFARFYLITDDEPHPKFLSKAILAEVFPNPVPVEGPNCTIFLIRHGESEANVEKKHDNPSLTEKGVKDAIQAGKAILLELEANSRFVLVSSPLIRAVQTMDAVKEVLGLSQLTILDSRPIETVRGLGRPIHIRGSKATDETIIACNANLKLDAYRIEYICDPKITDADLEKLVVPNRLPPNWREFPNTFGSLLEEQLKGNWPEAAAKTGLVELVSEYIAMAI